MFLMDRFFDGAFLTFGLEVIAFAEQDQEDRLDPLIYVFPRMTKVSRTESIHMYNCTLYKLYMCTIVIACTIVHRLQRKGGYCL